MCFRGPSLRPPAPRRGQKGLKCISWKLREAYWSARRLQSRIEAAVRAPSGFPSRLGAGFLSAQWLSSRLGASFSSAQGGLRRGPCERATPFVRWEVLLCLDPLDMLECSHDGFTIHPTEFVSKERNIKQVVPKSGAGHSVPKRGARHLGPKRV